MTHLTGRATNSFKRKMGPNAIIQCRMLHALRLRSTSLLNKLLPQTQQVRCPPSICRLAELDDQAIDTNIEEATDEHAEDDWHNSLRVPISSISEAIPKSKVHLIHSLHVPGGHPRCRLSVANAWDIVRAHICCLQAVHCKNCICCSMAKGSPGQDIDQIEACGVVGLQDKAGLLREPLQVCVRDIVLHGETCT